MSRIGRLPIAVPSGVEVKLDGQYVEVKGPKGTLNFTVREPITVSKNDEGAILVERPDDERENRSLHGLTRTLINNMVIGVTEATRRSWRSRAWVTACCPRAPSSSSSISVSHTR